MTKLFPRLPGLLSVAAVLLLTTCKRDGLPPETQEGANTFGCKINGKNWVPTGTPGKPSGRNYPGVNGGFVTSVLPDFPKWNVYLRLYRDSESLFIYLNKVTKPGEYLLKYTTETKPNALFPPNYGSFINGDKEEYVTNSTYTGWVNITKADTLTRTVSGTFEFTAANRTNPSQTIHVTSGRFDIKH
jgi:hypothetical protein